MTPDYRESAPPLVAADHIRAEAIGRPATTAAADPDELLTRANAARLLDMHEFTLLRWRQEKIGPPWVQVGRWVRYRRGDLMSWVAANTVHPSQPHVP